MNNPGNGTLMDVFTNEVKGKAEEFMEKFRGRVGHMTLADMLVEFFFFASSENRKLEVPVEPVEVGSSVPVMEVREFLESGLLQELNRQFLHPRGLALEVREDEGPNGEKFYSFGRIWDFRSDLVGIIFGDEVSGSREFVEKFERVKQMFLAKRDERIKSLGWSIQPVSGRVEPNEREGS